MVVFPTAAAYRRKGRIKMPCAEDTLQAFGLKIITQYLQPLTMR